MQTVDPATGEIYEEERVERSERERLAWVADNLDHIPDDLLIEAALLIEEGAKFYSGLLGKFKQAALDRLNGAGASLLNAPAGWIEKVAGKPTYEWDIDRLRERVLPLVPPAEREKLIEEIPPPPPVTKYKANTVKLNALAKKLGEKGAEVDACRQRIEGPPSIVFHRNEGQ